MTTRASWALPLMLAGLALAHDEGHGPKLTDQPKMGGVLTGVVAAKDAKLGPKAALVYKAEMVRSEDGTVRVYLYDKDLNPLDLAKFEREAAGTLEDLRKKKPFLIKFKLALVDGAFTGKAPKASKKPFNIDVTLKEGERKLLAAFDNLD